MENTAQDYRVAIGMNVRRVRLMREIPQARLGEGVSRYLGETWTRQLVSRIEQGRRHLDGAELVAVALELGTGVPDLLAPPQGGAMGLTFHEIANATASFEEIERKSRLLDVAITEIDERLRQLEEGDAS